MLFSSPRLTRFFQEELGYPEQLMQTIQEDFFETFLLYLETEINLYFERNNLEEEYKKLADIQKNDGGLQTGLIQAFIDLYIKYPEIKESVDEKMSYFTKMFISNIKNRMTEEQLTTMNKIIEEDIATYAKARKQLSLEI